MHESRFRRDAKFATSERLGLADTWDALQQIQTDFCFAQELSPYFSSESWLQEARHVLDVGTGNGYFLNRLREHFPGKQYHGVDISAEFITLATERYGHTGLTFAIGDYFDIAGVYDFVIMRLFWQHLPVAKLADAFAHLLRITRPGSSVLITDAYDDARVFVPDLPVFRDVIVAYSRRQRTQGYDRDVVTALVGAVEASGSWRVGQDLRLIMPSSIPGYLDLYFRVYDLWLDLFEHLNYGDMELGRARAELKTWKSQPGVFTQAGIRVLRIDRL